VRRATPLCYPPPPVPTPSVSALSALALRGLALAVLVGCTTAAPPRVEPPGPTAPSVPLPADRTALLAEADRTAADGPSGPDLARSLAACRALLAVDPSDGDALWRSARARYLRIAAGQEAEPAEAAALCMSDGERARAALPGAPSAFFHALCMGARAQAVNLEGLGLIKRMVEAGEAARAADPSFAHGGPDRLLGGIYLKAPSWPTSVGDGEAAVEHLEAAVAVAPEWAENHLLLAEALLEEDREDEALAALERARAVLDAPEASGWRGSWTPSLEALAKRLTK
jgi:tetratricopeptide (TPR) repeat protein